MRGWFVYPLTPTADNDNGGPAKEETYSLRRRRDGDSMGISS